MSTSFELRSGKESGDGKEVVLAHCGVSEGEGYMTDTPDMESQRVPFVVNIAQIRIHSLNAYNWTMVLISAHGLEFSLGTNNLPCFITSAAGFIRLS